MKLLIVGLCLMALVGLLCGANALVCSRIVRETEGFLETADRAGTFDELEAASQSALTRWQRGCRWLAVVTPNDQLDAVELELRALQRDAADRNADGCRSHLAVLTPMLETVRLGSTLDVLALF